MTDTEKIAYLLETLKVLRHTAGDLRNGFSRSVDPNRWVDQFQYAADQAIFKVQSK